MTPAGECYSLGSFCDLGSNIFQERTVITRVEKGGGREVRERVGGREREEANVRGRKVVGSGPEIMKAAAAD